MVSVFSMPCLTKSRWNTWFHKEIDLNEFINCLFILSGLSWPMITKFSCMHFGCTQSIHNHTSIHRTHQFNLFTILPLFACMDAHTPSPSPSFPHSLTLLIEAFFTQQTIYSSLFAITNQFSRMLIVFVMLNVIKCGIKMGKKEVISLYYPTVKKRLI